MEALQKQYDSVVASRDQLQEAFDRLDPKANTTGRKSESLFFFFLAKIGRLYCTLMVQILPGGMKRT